MKITRHDTTLETVGDIPSVGETLPDFQVLDADEKTVHAKDFAGRYTLISVVPDINTRVCSVSTKHFNESADAIDGINFITISTNTIAQQQDWCAAENVHSMRLLSDVDRNFGNAMGLFVPENGTDARSVWVVDADGKIGYREFIVEQTNEPDYASALAYLETHLPK